MAEQTLVRCPFCKGVDAYPVETDFCCDDGPLYWTVRCPDCDARGPAVEMYDTRWSDEQRKWLDKFKSEVERECALSEVNKQRAIDLWNACGRE